MASKNWNEMSAIEKSDFIAQLTAPQGTRARSIVDSKGMVGQVKLAKALGIPVSALASTLKSALSITLLSKAGIAWNYSPSDVEWARKALTVVAEQE